ncbi:CRISPR-associated helicase Cas3' [Desulfovibrio sp. Fe33]|uniref:CRISPR-associated helicase Cas3' n=1 Tax=Desulfovibrio sp. Fe33 TaxID=3020842 RepID=UPI00234C4F20|nr:CRISPR-associated helicase Cas3' [Desulfovibrio sp. Fe33]
MQYNYWGKSFTDGRWHHLAHHCLDAAAVTERLLETNTSWQARADALSPLPSAYTRSLLLFLAACHDIGKFHPGFQRLVRPLGESLGHVRGAYAHHHTEYGLAFWEQLQPEDFLDLPDPYALQPLLTAALCHHGAPRDTPMDLGPSYGYVMPDVAEFIREMAATFLTVPCPECAACEEDAFQPLSWFAAGLFVLADWVGSNEHWFAANAKWKGVGAYWPQARDRAAEAVAALGLAEAAPGDKDGFAELLPHLRGCLPTPMQQAVLDLPAPAGPEMLIVEDLTGGGKTEAALLAARRSMSAGLAAGLYAALPTMATANAMYGRLAEAYGTLFRDGNVSLALAHGGAFLNDEYLASIGRNGDADDGRAVCSHWLADSRKKALLAPCGVGTIDQALLGVLGSKHQSLRLLGLCRSVLVADEVHSFDVYTGELLANLLRFHAALGGSAVLLSATMTAKLRERLIAAWREGRALAGKQTPPLACPPEAEDAPFPLLTRVTDEGGEARPVTTRRSLNVAVRPVNAVSGMLDALCAARTAGACACWIRNTVADVLEAARLLTEERGIPEDDVTVFHARFTGGDRAAIERGVLERFGKESGPEQRAGKILLASQVVEQSLDLDFDLLLSDLAPMELLIQRAGRCHRHTRPRPAGYASAVMPVLMPEPSNDAGPDWYARLFDKGQYVYPRPAVLWRTARLLCGKGAIVLPRDARELVEGAYADGAAVAPGSLDDAEMSAYAKERADASVAHFGMLKFPEGYAVGDSPWGDDLTAPTRLGEPARGVRLLRVDANGVRLWHDDSHGPAMDTCVRSEVRIPLRKLAEADIPASCETAVAELMAAMPDKGKWCICLPLLETAPGVWTGSGTDGLGRTVRFRYAARTGLEVD